MTPFTVIARYHVHTAIVTMELKGVTKWRLVDQEQLACLYLDIVRDGEEWQRMLAISKRDFVCAYVEESLNDFEPDITAEAELIKASLPPDILETRD